MKHRDNLEYIALGTVDSTNTYLHNYKIGEPKRLTLAVAEFQTDGRGATGGWESAEGENLTFSILTHPGMVPANQMFVLSEAIALAICDALNGVADGFQIKWPNDIYHGDGKVVGMLIENDLRGKEVSNCIMGVGVNVNQTRFCSDAPNPLSIAQIVGHRVNREAVLDSILDRFSFYYNKVEEGHFSEIHTEYLQHLYRKGADYRYEDEHGEFLATLIGVEPTGHLLLLDNNGVTRKYAFKEVKYIL